MTDMRDPWNPSVEEVRAWAFQSNAIEPEQDWPLVLASCHYEDLYLSARLMTHVQRSAIFYESSI